MFSQYFSYSEETQVARFVAAGCELPHTDLRYSVGFPIQRQRPAGLYVKLGLTLPPRAGVLVPKTHSFSCDLYLLAWFSLTAVRVKMVQAYHSLFARFVAVLLPRASHIGRGTLLNSLAFTSTLTLRIQCEASAASAKKDIISLKWYFCNKIYFFVIRLYVLRLRECLQVDQPFCSLCIN